MSPENTVHPGADENEPPLDEALLGTVAGTLGLRENWRPDEEDRQRVRSRLLAATLSPLEREALRADGALEPADRVLVERLRGALEGTARHLASKHGLPLPERLPEVVLARGRVALTLDRLRETRDDSLASSPASTPPRLVLADEEARSVLPTPGPGTVLYEVHSLAESPGADAPLGLGTLERLARQAIAKERGRGEDSSPPLPAVRVGDLLDKKYRIKREIGRGGFGTVYEAEDRGFGEAIEGAPVAIKVLNGKLAGSRMAIESFRAEAKILTTLKSPHIVGWNTFDETDDGLHYFVMEYVEGTGLDQILNPKDEDGKTQKIRLSAERTARILLQVVEALRVAHKQRLWHLDLKPNNVLVVDRAQGEDELIKVIDFGISQSAGAAATPEIPDTPDPSDASEGLEDLLGRSVPATVTAAQRADDEKKSVKRARGGTVLYASPEQCEHLMGKEDILDLDGRSDLYSLGIMAFRILTGTFPFEARTSDEAFHNHLHVAPRKVGSVPGLKVPRRLAAFVDRCLVKDRANRWPDAEAAHRELDRIVHPPKRAPILVAGVAVVAAGAISWVQWNRRAMAAPPLLNLFDERAGGTPSLVHVHPHEPERRLDLPGWRLALAKENIIVADGDPTLALLDPTSLEPLAGWSAEWRGPETVRVLPHEGGEEGSTKAQLELRSGSQALVRTGSFTLVRLGEWSLEDLPSLHGAGEEFDPHGQRLEVRIRGSRTSLEAVRSVNLYVSGVADPLERKSRADGSDRYSFDLGPLAERDRGSIRLRVEAEDASGHFEKKEGEYRLAGEPIEILAHGFRFEGKERSAVQQEYGVFPGQELFVRVNRKGSVRILVDKQTEGKAPEEFQGFQVPDGLEVVVPIYLLGLDKTCARFTGQLEAIASDENVVGDSKRRTDSERIDIEFEPEAPSLAVSVGGKDLLRAQQGWNYLARPSSELVLRVERSVQRQIRVISILQPLGGAPGAPVSSDLNMEQFVDLGHVAPASGPHILTLRALDLFNGQVGDPLDEFVANVFFDETPPKVNLALDPPPGDSDSHLVTEPGTTSVTLAIEDESPLQREADWVWEFRTPGQDVPETLSPGLVVPPAAWFTAEAAPRQENLVATKLWHSLFSKDRAPRDGKYSLTLRLGNTAVSQRSTTALNWEIGYREPEPPKLNVPQSNSDPAGPIWAFGQNWVFSVQAEDPNEIRAATVTVYAVDEAGMPLPRGPRREPQTLVPDESPNTFKLLGPTIEAVWSEKPVKIELMAVDRAGHVATASFGPCRMPRYDVRYPPTLVARDDPEDRMLLVRAAEAYDWNGSPQNRLEGEDRRTLERESVRIAPREIPSFYLDVHEVSRRQFLSFLQRDYADRIHWPAGFEPSETRRKAWLTDLSDPSRDDWPITGVTLAEACAYARFRGKRLPTLLEWEYAVRGGQAYRRHPLGKDLFETPPEGIRVGSLENLDSGSPLGVEAGSDYLPWPEGSGVGFWNLASNVREWTLTPALRIDETSRTTLFGKDPADLPARHYVSAGGSFAHGPFSYTTRRPELPTAQARDLGFRCAADAAELTDPSQTESPYR